MHNAAYAALGLRRRVPGLRIAPERLGAAIAGARALGIRHLAVSIRTSRRCGPLDEVDETARRIGAVNTVTIRAGRLVCFEHGLLRLVRARSSARRELAGKRARRARSGGTARAAV